nr:ribonuclease H-like domain-containing protein [Tanacetum cinerariifolium]
MAMLTMRAMSYDWSFQIDKEPTNYALMAFISLSSSGSDSLESVKSRLVVYQQNENVFEEDIKLLKLDVTLRDNALVELRKKFEAAEKEKDELKLIIENFQTSLKKLCTLLASQITDKTRLGYDNHVFNSTVFDCDELISSELDVNMPTSPVHDRYKSREGYHALPPMYTGTFMPPKPDLVFYDAFTASETIRTVLFVEPSTTKSNKDLSQPSVKPVEHPTPVENFRKDIPKSKGHRHSWNRKAFFCKSLTHLIKDHDYYEKKMVQKHVRNHAIRGNHQHYARMTHPHPHRNVVPKTVLTRSRLVPLNADRPVTTVVPQTNVQHQRLAKHGVNKQALKDKGVIDSGCSRYMTENISYLSDFKEINRGYVAFGGNPKGGKITCKGKIRTGKLDFDDVYFVKELKFNLYSVSQMCDKKNSVLFTDTKCLALSTDFKLSDENHGKQHRASCKSKPDSSVSHPLKWLHMDLFEPTFVKSLNKKSYCLVVTDNYSRFSWVFFLATKDETSTILKTFITGIENQKNHKVKIIRSNNGTEFKNYDLNQFCGMKGIKREFSVATTPQQNRIAKRKNRTLIKAAGTMLADSLLPIPFWAEAVNTTCYVQNRVLVTKPHNKTPYELLLGRIPSIEFTRPFGCTFTILNTPNPLGKFYGKADKGFLVRYSVSSKAFKVFNSRARIVQETLHINFLENQPNVVGNGPAWLFDIDTLTQFMNYQPVVAGNQPNHNAGIQENLNVGTCVKETVSVQQYMLLPLWSNGFKDPQNIDFDDAFDVKENESEVHVSPKFFDNNTNGVNAASTPVTAVGPNLTNNTISFSAAGPSNTAVSLTFEIGQKYSFVDPSQYLDDLNMLALEDITYSDDEEDADITYSDDEEDAAPQTRSMAWMAKEQGGLTQLNDEDFHTCMFGHIQDEGIDYEEVFAPVARIEAIRLFLAYASFMGFMVYQMDVKSDFLYGTIKEKVYVCQPLGFEDPDYPDKLYKVFKSLHALHQAPRAWCETLANYLLENGFQRGKIDQTLFIKKQKGDILLVQMSSMGELTFFLGVQVKQKPDRIFISQDKYVAKILGKFGLTDGKSASTPINTEKPLLKDLDGEDVDIHIYRSIIGSLMYLTSSRPDIMFAVYACAHFHVTPKALHLHAVKRIFSNYAGASLDRKSTTGGFDEKDIIEVFTVDLKLLLSDRRKVIITKDSIRQAFRLDDATGVDTPLFDGMLVPQQAQDVKDDAEDEDDVNEVSVEPNPPSPTPAIPSPSPTQEHIPLPPQAQTAQPSSPPQQQPSQTAKISMTLLNQLLETCATLTKQVVNMKQNKIAQSIKITKLKQRVRRLEKKRQYKSSGGCIQTGGKIAELDYNEDVTLKTVDAEVAMDADVQGSMQDTDEAELAEVEEVVKVVTTAKLMTEVVTTAATTIAAAQVPKASAPRRRRGVIIQDLEETATASVIVHTEDKSKDKGKGIIVKEPKPLKRQAQIEQDEAFARQKPVTEAHARKNMMVYFKNMVGFKMDFFRGMTYNEIRPIFEKHYSLNQAFLERVEKEVTSQEEEGSKRKDDSLEQRATKKQKIDEETEELKTHLQIIANDDDDVYTEATPLALKVYVVNYQIHHEYNKHFYKIIRADGTHQLFLSFITLLKNFDREDLEMLWKLVQERF